MSQFADAELNRMAGQLSVLHEEIVRRGDELAKAAKNWEQTRDRHLELFNEAKDQHTELRRAFMKRLHDVEPGVVGMSHYSPADIERVEEEIRAEGLARR